MLGVLEKVVWGITLLVIISFATWVGVYGLPSTIPAIAMNSKKVSEQKLKLTPEAKAAVEVQKVGFEQSDDGSEIARKSGKRRRPVTAFQVDRNTEERLGNLNNCITEMNFASSEVDPETGALKVFDIKEGSLLEKVGLENNDVLERIGGKVVDFGDHLECHNVWQENLARLKTGTPIVVELRRNGQTQQLIIAPE